MATLRATLTRKIGPLPLWAWGGAVVGGVVVSRVLLRRRGAPAAGEAPAPNFLTVGEAMPIGLGESALPVDVTGRAPEPFFEAFPSEPIGFEALDFPGGGFGFDVAPTPSPTTVVAGTAAAGCVGPTLPAGFRRYPDAPNRFCPHGWHLALRGPCAGKCVPSTLGALSA